MWGNSESSVDKGDPIAVADMGVDSDLTQDDCSADGGRIMLSFNSTEDVLNLVDKGEELKIICRFLTKKTVVDTCCHL